ncbi:MAG TPA: hypothetical protein VHE99_08330 [Gammaproteobacteria bacterium]|nr:hypothetical protein [Gammaproteobacteria bacterium]
MTQQSSQTHKGKMTPISDKKGIEIFAKCPTPDEVTIYFTKKEDIPNVTAYSLQILKEILSKACLSSATISSVIRSSKGQADAMYRNMSNGKKIKYKLAGQQVQQVYLDEKESGKTPAQIRQAMENKINELAKNGKFISRHIGQTPSVYNVFDVAPSSISNPKKFLYIAHHDSRVTKVLDPKNSGDPAYHFEIAQPASDIKNK